MRTGSTIADPPVPVTLKEQDLLRRGQRLAEKIGVRSGLVEAKKAANKRAQDEIDSLDAVIAAEARVICDGFENVEQGDLRFDDTTPALPPSAASQRIAQIAAWSAKHPFVADAEKIDTCAREGCGGQAGADVHVAPLPSQPHKFVGDGTGTDHCWSCASGQADPVHAEPKAEPVAHEFIADGTTQGVCSVCGGSLEHPIHGAAEAPAADPNAPHAAVLGEQPDGEPKACLFCSRAVDDPMHRLEELAADLAAVLDTFVCDDCIASGADVAAATHPKADGMWLDADARKVCPNCRQAAIEGGRWAHTFKAGHLRAKKCSDCGFRLDHATHVPPDEEPANQAPPPAATGDPAYDFDDGEKPPAVISSARAIEETPEDAADDGNVGGEAGA